MGLLSLAYKRPDHVHPQGLRASSESPDDASSQGTLQPGRRAQPAGIPDSLAFDNIINGDTCPVGRPQDPCIYYPENLQFHLWHRDYVERFDQAPRADTCLSPEWTQAMEEEAMLKLRKEQAENRRRPHPPSAPMFKGTMFENSMPEMPEVPEPAFDPFSTPPSSCDGKSESGSLSVWGASHSTLSDTSSKYKSRAANAYRSAGARVPFTIQPFRDEINRVMATFIVDGAPRQLNLSSLEQKAAVQALSYTTHPSALRGLCKTVDHDLRRQSHPNFVRWSIRNGNPARVWFARVLGAFLVVAGFAIAILTTLSRLARSYRALAAVAWVLGVSTFVAGYNGVCVVLHGRHRRHLRPWEIFGPADDEEDQEGRGEKRSLDCFGLDNGHEDKPWVAKYERRHLVRKIFDREVWIQEPALRQIQDTIFVQAILASVAVGGALTALFVVVPGGNLF
ncbi:hypothetical protein UVI_02032700 [Ustilaginoidea virens]|uniref:Regulator of G protein signaling superfamily n=1 Tax=Ustilaginoidea virens TaxID=1159556 RepID=A0A1B5KUB4_USTVR|nr:hypothetical protein UVI_02032700 [Ustilaginoidea virens]